ncbi:hypothetical protein [Streptomyces sp. SID13031]|uniref:hypothetical protein n=1 Tax=Streptomyces sp. SID13031 TaxID=2706046 RepID=UPI0013C8569F|nr:hypothetical protein [Streptomyces sp. SID13031]NEA34990.1 hypothetical protein [Streptomyces sp. SID13031]
MSEGNAATAMAIARDTGTTGILIGSFLVFLPIAIASTSTAYVARHAYRIILAKRLPTYWEIFTTVITLMGMSILIPVRHWLFLPIGLFMAISFGATDRSEPGRQVARSPTAVILSLLVFPFAATLVTSSTAWLPTEVIDTSDPGNQKVIGYVIKNDSNTLSILRRSPRNVLYLTPNSIKKREICGRQNWRDESLVNLAKRGRGTYPDCP